MRQKFLQQVNLENRNEMINFLNNHPISKIHTDFPSKWTYANNIGFMYTIPLDYHLYAFEAITDQPKDKIEKLIYEFKFKWNFKFGTYRADYNQNILLLVHRYDTKSLRGIKIQNFEKFPYEDCSDYFLQQRTKLICEFDVLCDKIINEYHQMITRYIELNKENII